MKKEAMKQGFTLIELSLSLAFIGILSLMVVLLIQNITSSYRRGLILNEINTVGMDLIDDFRSSVQNASSYSVLEMCRTYYGEGSANWDSCVNTSGGSFVSVTKYGTIKVNDKTIGDEMPIYGAFCTGTYTYIWNSGYFEATDNEKREISFSGTKLNPATLKMGDGDVVSGFRLLKVFDSERTVCVNAMKAQDTSASKTNYVSTDKYSNGKITRQFKLDQSMVDADPDNESGIEIMKRNNASDLVLYDLYVSTPALSTTRENLFVSASFILGTKRGGIDITRAGNSCKPPSDDLSELEYCAINKFNFAVQAGGE